MIWFGWVLWRINHCELFNAKPSLYIYSKYIWFGLFGFLWHINYCRLFNAKSSLYIYIKYIWFGLVGFYGISTIVGYLMPNLLYTYIFNIYDFVGFYGISTIISSKSSGLHSVEICSSWLSYTCIFVWRVP